MKPFSQDSSPIFWPVSLSNTIRTGKYCTNPPCPEKVAFRSFKWIEERERSGEIDGSWIIRYPTQVDRFFFPAALACQPIQDPFFVAFFLYLHYVREKKGGDQDLIEKETLHCWGA